MKEELIIILGKTMAIVGVLIKVGLVIFLGGTGNGYITEKNQNTNFATHMKSGSCTWLRESLVMSIIRKM